MINHIRANSKLLIKYLNKYNINYWLDFGTLLGCIREHNIIEWDTDADFSILNTEINKVKLVIKEIQQENKNLLINDFNDYKIFKLHELDKNNNVFYCIDIYIWKNEGSIYRNIEQSWGQGGLNVFPAEEINVGFKYVDFLEELARIPINFHNRLTRLYDNYNIPKRPGKNGYYWDDNIGKNYIRRNRRTKQNRNIT